MQKKLSLALMILLLLGVAGWFLYPRIFHPKVERKVLYWTDPMLPGDRSDRPGRSPMGMERVPVYEDEQPPGGGIKVDTVEKDYYTCPMHPSVRASSPGTCPVCGMTLVKTTARS